jgi:hypothetical protein
MRLACKRFVFTKRCYFTTPAVTQTTLRPMVVGKDLEENTCNFISSSLKMGVAVPSTTAVTIYTLIHAATTLKTLILMCLENV